MGSKSTDILGRSTASDTKTPVHHTGEARLLTILFIYCVARDHAPNLTLLCAAARLAIAAQRMIAMDRIGPQFDYRSVDTFLPMPVPIYEGHMTSIPMQCKTVSFQQVFD